jgi:polar amino acid transport system permease protein
MMWDWDNAIEVFPLILKGLQVTLIATVFGAALSYVLGLIFALLRMSRLGWIRTITYWVVEFIRTTPLVVQLFFLFYFFVPNVLGIRPADPLLVGIIGLGLHYAGYTSEVYRAGIEGVPRGQWEAATALSLPQARVWRAVILPQAIPKVLPALGNYTIAMFKETPLLIVLGGVNEMVNMAKGFGGRQFSYVEAYTEVAAVFLVLSISAALLVQLMERRLGRQRV